MPADALSRAVILELLQQLIRIPSVNPTLAPEEGHGEAAIAAFASQWLAARGLHSWLEEAATGRPNVVAEAGEGPSRQPAAFGLLRRSRAGADRGKLYGPNLFLGGGVYAGSQRVVPLPGESP